MRFPDLDRYPYIAYDTETTGLRYPIDQVFGFSIATPDSKAGYWDIRHDPEAREWWERALPEYKGTIICHNASFDWRMSLATGVRLPLENLDDTQIRAALLDEHLSNYSLDSLGERCLGERKLNDIYTDLASMFGGRATRKAQMGNLFKAPPDLVAGYGRQDALLTMHLWEWQNDEAERQDNPWPLCLSIRDAMNFERRLMSYIIRLECNGIPVDVDRAKQAAEDLTVQIDEAERKLVALVGRPINVNSAPQVRDLFRPTMDDTGDWTVAGILLESTETGGPSLNANALRQISTMDERASLILKIRSLIKTRDTFLMGHVVGHAIDGRVYPRINQTKGDSGGTGTGRLSYQDPAMQQIPSRNKGVASIVKPVFLPEDGQEWLDADENSFEVRIFAHLVSRFDQGIVEVYEKNPRTDFHQYVADLTGLVRNATYSGEPNAKQLNLSAIFNAGNGSIAEQMGKPWWWDEFEAEDGGIVRFKKAGPEAMEIINRYHEALPGVKKLMKAARAAANHRGFIYTKTGRRIRFPKKFKTHKASGLLIQGTAADYNKENIMMIMDIMDRVNGSLLLNTHDSYSMSIPRGSYETVIQLLRDELEDPDRARVPLLLDVSGVGDTWWGALNNERGVEK